MSQVGSRAQTPATPKPDTPNAQTQNSGTTPQASTQPKPADDAQLRQQLEQAYQNTDNGKAGQQMIDNQAADVAQKKKVVTEALGKMNFHNRRADEYLKKSHTATDPAQKKNFENLANAQFEEAVKAEAAYNKAKADTLKSQNELNAIKQENDRYKNPPRRRRPGTKGTHRKHTQDRSTARSRRDIGTARPLCRTRACSHPLAA